MFKITRFVLAALVYALVAAPLPASAEPKTPPEELRFHQLGMLMGYCNYCAKLAGKNNSTNPEGRPFGVYYGAKYRFLGPKGILLFKEGVKKGIFSAVSDSGAQCRQNLAKLVRLYRDIGLKGSFYSQTADRLPK